MQKTIDISKRYVPIAEYKRLSGLPCPTIKNVRGYLDDNGVAHLHLEDVARGLGFTETAKSGNVTIRWRTVRSYLEEFGIASCCDGKAQTALYPPLI